MYLVAQQCPTLCNPMDWSPLDSSLHGIFPGKNTGVGCHFLLQGIFLTQRLNLCLLHWQADSFIWATWSTPRAKTPFAYYTSDIHWPQFVGEWALIKLVLNRLSEYSYIDAWKYPLNTPGHLLACSNLRTTGLQHRYKASK